MIFLILQNQKLSTLPLHLVGLQLAKTGALQMHRKQCHDFTFLTKPILQAKTSFRENGQSTTRTEHLPLILRITMNQIYFQNTRTSVS